MRPSADEALGTPKKAISDTASLTSVEGAAELIKVLDAHPTGGVIFLLLIVAISVCWAFKRK
jgi:hypothetical protein